MRLKRMNRNGGVLLSFVMVSLLLLPGADAATCTTQSQMTASERSNLADVARAMVDKIRSGNTEALRANTIPAVAANFSGISASVESLKPKIQSAAITVDNLYLLDASSGPAGTAPTSFFCGEPLVVLNFNQLPAGKYALAILHATGVPEPHQISLILSETSPNHWMLAGLFSNPMLEAGHDGLWYWTKAREFAQKKMDWNAWLYYQAAGALLQPAPFLSSPNLGKLRQEADRIRPPDFPGAAPTTLSTGGSTFSISSVGITTEFGGLDLEVQYLPDATQLSQLRDPVSARKQAITVMTALLERHPDLRAAFHGIWVRAAQGSASVYSLELPMDQITTGPTAPQPKTSSVTH